MKILVISQAFWPDTASTSQHLTDLAVDLTIKGHSVKVFSSRRDYENPKVQYEKKDKFREIEIVRIWNTGFGKSGKIGRILDFMTFNVMLFLRLLSIKKYEYNIIVGMTSPPLISFVGVIIAQLKKAKFIYWAMDLQPELSIATGYIKKGSIGEKILLGIADFTFKKADHIIALDKYMAKYILKKGIEPARNSVIPVWPVMKEVYNGNRRENPFRIENGFGDKIVVMYSGNHSVVHPLDTLLNVVSNLKDDNRFLFVFIGGGVRKQDVTDYKIKHNLDNILQIGYQKRERIHFSLGAADIHVVIQGSNSIGFTHPNKIYGAMCIGSPILYIGPRPSHISDILEECQGNISVEHGEVKKLENQLLKFANMDEEDRNKVGLENMLYVQNRFTRQKLVGEIIEAIEIFDQ